MAWNSTLIISIIGGYVWRIARVYVDVGDYIKMVIKFKETKSKNIEEDMKKAMQKLGKIVK